MKKMIVLLATVALLVCGCGKKDPSGTSVGKSNWNQFQRISEALIRETGELEFHQQGESQPLRMNAMVSYELYMQFQCQFKTLTPQQIETLFETGKLSKDGKSYYHAEGYMEGLRIYFKNLHDSYGLSDGSEETQSLRQQARNQIAKYGLLCINAEETR